MTELLLIPNNAGGRPCIRGMRIRVSDVLDLLAAVSIPLVLHGGSGTPHEKIKEVIRLGFAKVNVATEFQHTFQLRLETELKKLNGNFLPLDKLMMPATDDAVIHLRRLIQLFTAP